MANKTTSVAAALPISNKAEQNGDLLHVVEASTTEHGHDVIVVVVSADEISDIIVFRRNSKENRLEVKLAGIEQHFPKAFLKFSILRLLVYHRFDHRFIVKGNCHPFTFPVKLRKKIDSAPLSTAGSD